MSLAEYRRKRDFKRTSEPKGAVARRKPKTLRFVVQHHLASHEHDDFRLELDGVLKSWAVPKRVSRTRGVRRLAIQVEDHPLGYAAFEGVIPKGQYGAGTVSRWDEGTWEPIGDPHEGLAEGKLVFTLQGDRLKGRWALVRIEEGNKPQWLLMRTADS
jgi:bifunctional non-homologous end joining protein LigD